VRVTFFGVRGSCPCSSDQQRRYGGNTSCVLVEVGGAPPLIIDLGTGLRALGGHLASQSEAGEPFRATALLSHLHYDHVLGLPFFSPLRSDDAVLEVFGPAQDAGPLDQVLAGIVQPPFFPIRMGQFQGELRFHDLEGTEQFAVGEALVTARRIPHIGTTLGFRIEADGATVAYLSDHQAPADGRTVDDRVRTLCEGADLVIHDAQYSTAEFATLADWGHSTVEYAVHVATVSGARRLALFHHDPAHTDGDIDTMLAHARCLADGADAPEVSAAAEGVTIELGRVLR
jgi:phosphoribosyl 1,2-cyclic phosphodiesterase